MKVEPKTQAKDLWKNTVAVFLSGDEVDVIYTRLEGLQIALDADPLLYGPKRLQNKIANVRAALGECERIFLQLSHRQHAVQRELRAKRAALDLSKMLLFSEDPEVRAGRNVSDREALAAVKLKEEWLEVHRLDQIQQDLTAVLLVVKAKRGDLRDTQGRLRDQIRLCQTEVDLGGRWGTMVPYAREIVPGQGVATIEDITSVDALIREVGDETDLPDLSGGFTEMESPFATVAAAAQKKKAADADALRLRKKEEEVSAEDPFAEDGEISQIFAEVAADSSSDSQVLPGSSESSEDLDTMISGISAGEDAKNKVFQEDENFADLLDFFS